MRKTAKRPLKASSANAVSKAVADVVNQWREVAASARELAGLRQTMADIARDLGFSPTELQILAAKGANAAKELPCLLESLRISIQTIAEKDPMVLRDLQRVCSICDHKRRCGRNIAAGMLAENYDRYCPNAETVNAIKRDPTFADARSSGDRNHERCEPPQLRDRRE